MCFRNVNITTKNVMGKIGIKNVIFMIVLLYCKAILSAVFLVIKITIFHLKLVQNIKCKRKISKHSAFHSVFQNVISKKKEFFIVEINEELFYCSWSGCKRSRGRDILNLTISYKRVFKDYISIPETNVRFQDNSG